MFPCKQPTTVGNTGQADIYSVPVQSYKPDSLKLQSVRHEALRPQTHSHIF